MSFSGCHHRQYLPYRIRVIKPPLLIKPPIIQNSNKPPLFYPKSPLFGAFLVKFWKNFNKPPAQNLDFFIDRRRFIDADTVIYYILNISTLCHYRPFSRHVLNTSKQ